MASQSLHCIRIPREAFEKHNTRRRAGDYTWLEYLERQAPPYVPKAEFIGQIVRQEVRRTLDGDGVDDIVREEVGAVIEEADLGDLLGLGEEPEPLEPLVEKDGDVCQVCGEEQANSGVAITHLLLQHPDECNQRHREVDRRRRKRGEGVQIDWAGSENGDEPIRVNEDGPAAFYSAPTDRGVGQAWGNGDAPDARECDIGGAECMGTMSKNYARVFARAEDGRLACPNCLSRSARYSADSPAPNDARTDPASVTGADNPRMNLTIETGDD